MAYSCKEAIIGIIAASGPQDTGDLRRECKIQATDYSTENFAQALRKVKAEGTIVLGDEGWYDFSEEYYDRKG